MTEPREMLAEIARLRLSECRLKDALRERGLDVGLWVKLAVAFFGWGVVMTVIAMVAL